MKKKFNITAILYDKRGKVLSIGKNSYVKTHPLQAHYAAKVGEPKKVFLHAELAAIIKCPDITKAYRLVVFRYNDDGTPGSTKPCCICQKAISKTSIVKVEHT